ncbi:flagellar assembly protein FliH [Idiomarina tyrosinivorans]|uniref:Flagellar assembly protein FliH n=1 Tax=Idiomarina tyrosinivorans TaxID=1445662 RepID=A0A432ZSJ5_9GAMM|nr:flagellar assembly protein FliH [Idiomarina tyrosinivorans]RUO80880.1 flagellar assembly protein FliH [Idiomarina tyrosinivorans]
MTEDKTSSTSLWDLPDITDAEAQKQSGTNALNKPRRWQYEPPEADHVEEAEAKPLTAEELEQIREAARQEGYQEGLKQGFEDGHQQGLQQGKEEGLTLGQEEGREQGITQGQEEVAEQLSALAQVIDELQQPLQVVDKQVREQLLQMVIELARQVCLVEVTQSIDVIKQSVEKALDVLPVTDERVVIHLHPDDLEILTEHYGEDTLKDNGWLLSKDELQQRGGCRVTTESSSVDFTLAARMQDVFSQVLGRTDVSDESN